MTDSDDYAETLARMARVLHTHHDANPVKVVGYYLEQSDKNPRIWNVYRSHDEDDPELADVIRPAKFGSAHRIIQHLHELPETTDGATGADVSSPEVA